MEEEEYWSLLSVLRVTFSFYPMILIWGVGKSGVTLSSCYIMKLMISTCFSSRLFALYILFELSSSSSAGSLYVVCCLRKCAGTWGNGFESSNQTKIGLQLTFQEPDHVLLSQWRKQGTLNCSIQALGSPLTVKENLIAAILNYWIWPCSRVTSASIARGYVMEGPKPTCS